VPTMKIGLITSMSVLGVSARRPYPATCW
jgi:hypothetical protein